MGCDKARFGQKGKKTPKIENLGLKVCSVGSRGDPHIRAWGNPRWELEASCTELEATRIRMLMPLELLLWVASRSQGTNFETKIFNFRCFFGLKLGSCCLALQGGYGQNHRPAKLLDWVEHLDQGSIKLVYHYMFRILTKQMKSEELWNLLPFNLRWAQLKASLVL